MISENQFICYKKIQSLQRVLVNFGFTDIVRDHVVTTRIIGAPKSGRVDLIKCYVAKEELRLIKKYSKLNRLKRKNAT
jgi:hypothetical protein